MPVSILTKCHYPRCASPKPCPKHEAEDIERKRGRRREHDEERGTAAQRGYGGRWQRYRRMFLGRYPLCAECLSQRRIVAATVVDHVEPHRGDQGKFWDPANHQALCKPCHDRKTARGE